MKQETTTLHVTPKTRRMAKQVAALTNDKVYNAVERAVEKELERLQGKSNS